MSMYHDFAMNSESDYDQAVTELRREGVQPTPEAIAERKTRISAARRQAAEDQAIADLTAEGLEPTPEAVAAKKDEVTVRRISMTRAASTTNEHRAPGH